MAADGSGGQPSPQRWAAVLGSPVRHSLSPVLHRAAYAALGLDGWRYEASECDERRLASVVDRARRDPGWVGFSLTMPLKLAAVELVDELDELAATVGAVNTLVPREDRLFGANTDVTGMIATLDEQRLPRPRTPVVLGGGGSALAALAALAARGATEVRVAVRSRHRLAALEPLAHRLRLNLHALPWTPTVLDGTDLVVSTVPAGATDDWVELPWPRERALFDILYHPWPTPLAAHARASGAPVVDGLALLAHQAVGQLRLMTGRDVDAAVLLEAGRAALAE